MRLSSVRTALFFSVLAVFSIQAATFTWTGIRNPAKISQGDGISGYPSKIGTFTLLSKKEDWGQFVFNVNNHYPQSKAWATWAVGTIPENITPLTEAKHNEYLTYMDQLSVTVLLELIPTNQNVVTLINENLTKYSSHPCVAGIGVDLEYYTGAIDAKAWDDKAKTFNENYRFYFKHWETAKIPSYRGKGDFIYICTSSEGPVASLTTAVGSWASAFAPSAVAFQIGYPADEDAENGSRGGWAALADPVKDWGNQILAKINSSTQEVGILWVTVKSGKSYNTSWDLTKGATLPSTSVMPGYGSVDQFGFTPIVARITIAGMVEKGNALPSAASIDILGRNVRQSGRQTVPGFFIYKFAK